MRCTKTKFLCYILVLVFSISMTGCGFIDSFDSDLSDIKTQESQSSSFLSKVGKDNQHVMQSATKSAQNAALRAQTASDDALADYKAGKKFKEEHPIQNFFRNIPGGKKSASQLKNVSIDAAANREKAVSKYEAAKASDESFQGDKAKSNKDMMKIILIIVVVAAVLVLILYLMKRGSTAISNKAQAAPERDAVRRDPRDFNPSFNKRGYNRQEKQLQDMCAAQGISYDEYVGYYGTDTAGLSRAYVELSTGINRGDDNAKLLANAAKYQNSKKASSTPVPAPASAPVQAPTPAPAPAPAQTPAPAVSKKEQREQERKRIANKKAAKESQAVSKKEQHEQEHIADNKSAKESQAVSKKEQERKRTADKKAAPSSSKKEQELKRTANKKAAPAPSSSKKEQREQGRTATKKESQAVSKKEQERKRTVNKKDAPSVSKKEQERKHTEGKKAAPAPVPNKKEQELKRTANKKATKESQAV